MILLDVGQESSDCPDRRHKCHRMTRDVNDVMGCKVTGRDCVGKKKKSQACHCFEKRKL